jgi:hypothetical protein
VSGPQNQCESGIWNLLHRKQVVRLEDELAVTMMGSSKGLLLKQLYSFLNHFNLQSNKRFNVESLKLDFGSAILFKSQTRFKMFDSLSIKMTQKWINVVDNGSNKVQTMSF